MVCLVLKYLNIMIIEIKSLIWLDTPKGLAVAKFLIDYGPEADLMWVCFGQDGEIWTWENNEVRATKNRTLGRKGIENELG